ncbi:MAG: translocation/assembly module TamB domain-containing protein [Phenylobacterium sp.]|uniref:translocation/assembly module TamB domain-containing protein n=1 Tax=Phenylobacterium sp. TaxID=1871053 RepID=UPI00391D9244
MSEGPDTPGAAAPKRERSPRVGRIAARAGMILAVVALVIAALGVAGRFVVLAPGARQFIETRVDGLKAGRFGRLQVEGLDGDLWRDFTVRRLAIADEKGVWVEAEGLHMAWRPSALLTRTVAIDLLTARQVRVLRRPVLGQKTPSGGMPVSIHIGDLRTRLEMLPAFSYERGVYDVAAALTLRRNSGGQSGRVTARSLLHAGDRLEARFDIGSKRPLLIDLEASEARGGALAGALGLPADRRFAMSVHANGRMSSGKFTASATSGEATPLKASGAWSEQGGQADGRLSLTASELTRPLADRLGDEVSFMIYGRRTPGELFALDARVTSENVTAVARGQGDIGERRTGPAGVAVRIDVDDLSRLTGVKGLGAANVDGVLRGETDDLRFEGQADVGQVAVGGYELRRVSGPIAIGREGKELSVKASLTGAGGEGAGYLAALLGAAPKATLEARRMPNGRLLLRELTAVGSGLQVQASGGRTLLGALTFRGSARLSNLEAARPGASGGLEARWSADQSRANSPWAFTLDAEGQSLALGIAELDRLIGPSPTLTARAGLDGRRLSVERARLVGANLEAQTQGTMAEDGALAFTLDWSAQGPLHAGPVEISGKARGDGTLGGQLSAPRLELVSDFDQIDLPRLPLQDAHLVLVFARGEDGSSGSAALEADSVYGAAVARTDFRFPQGGVDLTNLNVDAGGVEASGSVSLRRRTPSAADLDLAVGEGAFLEGGRIVGDVRIVDAPAGPRADLKLVAQNAVLPGRRLAIGDARLDAEGPLARLPYTIAAAGAAARTGDWSLSGRGVYSDGEGAREITFDGSGKLGRRELRTAEPARVRFGPEGERTAQIQLVAARGGRLDADLRLLDGSADVSVTAADLDLGLLNEDLGGALNASLELEGRGEALSGTLQARLSGARGRGADASTGLDATLQARLSGDTLTLAATGSNAQGLTSKADFVLPAEASAAPFRVALDRTKPIRGSFSADGDVRPLWDLLVGGERTLSGHVRASGTVGGTLADPRAVGQAMVDGGRFTDGATGLALRDLTLRADFADNAVNVTEASAADGHGGGLTGGGRISLLREGASSFRLNLRDFRVIDNDTATASASGPVTIERAADGKMRISGELQINEAEIAAEPPTPSGVVVMEVVERNKPVDLETSLDPPVRSGPGIALDVSLKAPRRVFLRGRGLDLELSLDAHVRGTTSRPVLVGEARVVRGDYEFAGKRFEFDPRGVVYLATSAKDIRLDLTATRSDTSLVAVVRVQGTAAKPEITLTSTPQLPNDEVLSQVLFGASASQLSPLEAAQLASALSALAGGGGFDVIGGLRNFAGLDRLALGGGGESAVSVSGGKYLTDDVYLELTGGGRDGASAQVEWRVRDNLSIVSRLGGQGDAKLSIRWRKDY